MTASYWITPDGGVLRESQILGVRPEWQPALVLTADDTDALADVFCERWGGLNADSVRAVMSGSVNQLLHAAHKQSPERGMAEPTETGALVCDGDDPKWRFVLANPGRALPWWDRDLGEWTYWEGIRTATDPRPFPVPSPSEGAGS